MKKKIIVSLLLISLQFILPITSFAASFENDTEVSSLADEASNLYTVTIQYVGLGGELLRPNIVLSGKEGEAYTSEQLSLPLYDFYFSIGNTSGYFSYGQQQEEIKYVYLRHPYYIARYVDEEGTEISDTITYYAKVGDTYKTEQKDIPGYTLTEIPENVNGIVVMGENNTNKTVTYVYRKNQVEGGAVTIRYVDEEGNSIAETPDLSGNIGDPYSTEQKTISGYTFKDIQGNTSGTFTNESQTVTYIYSKSFVEPTSKNDTKDTSIKTNVNQNVDVPKIADKQLPTTGENSFHWYAAIGVLITLSAISFYLFNKKKKIK